MKFFDEWQDEAYFIFIFQIGWRTYFAISKLFELIEIVYGEF